MSLYTKLSKTITMATYVVSHGQTIFFLCHWIEKGQFESHNCLDMSQTYITIRRPMHLNSVIMCYINNRFHVPVDQSMIYSKFNGQ